MSGSAVSSAAPYDGVHLLADLHGAGRLGDMAHIEAALRAAAAAAGATLLDIRLHGFGPGAGVTGVALLAESHISIHTWPEHGYAAIDIFLCGARHDVGAALDVIAERLGARVEREVRMPRGFGAFDVTPAET